MDLNDGVARSLYKNKTVSDAFAEHNLAIFKAYLALRNQYPDKFTILTKAESADYDQFPESKPDLFLQSDATSYFLYIYRYTNLRDPKTHKAPSLVNERTIQQDPKPIEGGWRYTHERLRSAYRQLAKLTDDLLRS